MALATQVKDFPLLLEVFKDGLKLGLISKKEIVSWADRIIAITDEPEYFFIEVSLSSDINRLIEVLNRYIKPTGDPICDRVLLGLVSHRRPIYDVEDVEKVAAMVGSMSSWDRLTFFENDTICTFDDHYLYYSADVTQLQIELINFLSIYKVFTLENHEHWVSINYQVLELLKEEEIKVNVVNESLRKAWRKKEQKRNVVLYLKKTGVILLVLIFFGMFYSLFDNGRKNNYRYISFSPTLLCGSDMSGGGKGSSQISDWLTAVQNPFALLCVSTTTLVPHQQH